MATFRQFRTKVLKGISTMTAPYVPPINVQLLNWPCDDGEGTDITATAGPNGFGNFSWSTNTPDSSPYCLLFDSPSQYAQSATELDYGGNKVITLIAWIYSDDWSNMVVEFDSASESPQGGWLIQSNSGTITITITDSDGGEFVGSVAAPSSNAWHQFTFQMDNDLGATRVFIDGEEVSVNTDSDSHSVSSTFSNQVLYVAAQGGVALLFSGMIDEIVIWSGEHSAPPFDGNNLLLMNGGVFTLMNGNTLSLI